MVNINKIKNTCKTKGIKQGFLCTQLGVAKGYFNDVERGKNSMSEERIAKIAEILNVSIAYLTDETDDPSPVPGEPIPKTELDRMKDMATDLLAKIEDVQHLKMILAALEASAKQQTP